MFHHMTAARWTLAALGIAATGMAWAYPSRLTSALVSIFLFTVVIFNMRQRATGRRW